MDWRAVLLLFACAYYADGYSKYGRTCKDIGCLNSEVCVLAEDPCSFGHTSNCGTYPTCKKKSQVEGSHLEPVPAAPKPIPQSPTRDDSPPNYPAPAPPMNNNNSPYGGTSPYGGSGGNSPYGHSGGNSPYGSSGGNSPYGGSGGNSPYGGSGGNSPYGGSGGNSPYGGSGGNSPYGGSGGSTFNGGNSPYGGRSPYGGSSNRGDNPYGDRSPYGGSNPSSSGGFGSGGKSPLDSILGSLNNFGNGQPGQGGAGSLSNIFGNVLGNLSKSGGLSNFFNTRPIMENPNYSSYSSRQNAQASQPSQQPSQNRNYGQTYAHHNGATTNKPVSYGWNVG